MAPEMSLSDPIAFIASLCLAALMASFAWAVSLRVAVVRVVGVVVPRAPPRVGNR
jgi:hypothetical protein